MSSSTSITQYRHRKHLENCIQSLDAFLGIERSLIILLNTPYCFSSQYLTYFLFCLSILTRRYIDLSADDIVLGAEELRHAASDLGRITGRVDVEEVLDVVFREFCIGK